jgi:hypothetical protein
MSAVQLDRMLRLAVLSARLCQDHGLRRDALLSQLSNEIGAVESAQRTGAKEVECERLEVTATNKAEMESLLARLEGEVEAEEADSITKRGNRPKMEFLLYLLAWTNVFAAALYLTKMPVVWLDRWLCAYPALHALYLIYEIMKAGGVLTYFQSSKEPFRRAIRALNGFLVLYSLFGVLCYLRREGGDSIVEERYERFALASTALMVLTYSPYFTKMLNTCFLAIGVCTPFALTMCCIILLFSQLCVDLYKKNPKIPNGYFENFGISFVSIFWLFLGENFPDIMWDVASTTNAASTVLFVVFVFLSTLLFCQLVLGVVIGVYLEIAEFLSPRLYTALKPLYLGISDAEKERLVEDFLQINHLLLPLHERIEALSQEGGGSDRTWLDPNYKKIGSTKQDTIMDLASQALDAAGEVVVPMAVSVPFPTGRRCEAISRDACGPSDKMRSYCTLANMNFYTEQVPAESSVGAGAIPLPFDPTK